MKIAILGGAGYIGGALTLHLASKGHQITIVGSCRQAPKLEPHLQKHGLVPLVTLRAVEFANHRDIRDALEGHEYVIHAAGPSGEINCQRNMPYAADSHMRATLQMDDYIHPSPVGEPKQGLFLSSFSVYHANTVPYDEGMTLQPPQMSVYVWYKQFGEELLRSMRTMIFRLPHVYGYGVGYGIDPEGIVAKCVRAVMDEWPSMTISNGGLTQWQFLHVYDLALAVEKALESPHGHTFNVGNPKPVLLFDLLELVAQVACKKMPLVVEGSVSGHRYMNVDKSREMLGWSPSVLMEQGIREMIANYETWSR